MSRTNSVAYDPSVADRVLSHELRKYRRATSPRQARGNEMKNASEKDRRVTIILLRRISVR